MACVFRQVSTDLLCFVTKITKLIPPRYKLSMADSWHALGPDAGVVAVGFDQSPGRAVVEPRQHGVHVVLEQEERSGEPVRHIVLHRGDSSSSSLPTARCPSPPYRRGGSRGSSCPWWACSCPWPRSSHS